MKRKKTNVTIKPWSIVLAGMALAADVSAACSRESLQELTDTYVEAQTTGNAAMLPMAAGAYYGENDRPTDIADGMLSQAIGADFTRSFFDTTLCATFTEFVAATHAHPYVIHTRMEVNEEDEVTIMESVVTDEGDWVFGAETYLSYTQQEDWGVIPEGTPCTRLEGRIYTGARDPEGQTCTMGAFPQPINTGSRRFVIDETMGAVSIFHNFSWLDAGLGPYHPGTPASQQFRVEGGMNRYIHEVTVCTTPGCSRGGPPSGD